MSNLKKHFFHISKSWFSVCTFIFLLAVCVGLVIHITNKKENATCSNSEAPIVSNGNVSEESGSDIAHAENYVPTEEDVLVARQQATEGMSQQQVERLTEVIKAANLWLEQRYMDENSFPTVVRVSSFVPSPFINLRDFRLTRERRIRILSLLHWKIPASSSVVCSRTYFLYSNSCSASVSCIHTLVRLVLFSLRSSILSIIDSG